MNTISIISIAVIHLFSAIMIYSNYRIAVVKYKALILPSFWYAAIISNLVSLGIYLLLYYYEFYLLIIISTIVSVYGGILCRRRFIEDLKMQQLFSDLLNKDNLK